MSTITIVEHIDVTCFKCKNGFTWTHEGDYTFEPEHEKIACVGCAKKLGDNSMHWCLRCRAQFQSFSLYQMGCSWECENWIDEQAERAQDRDLEREQAWLESYGEEDEPEDERGYMVTCKSFGPDGEITERLDRGPFTKDGADERYRTCTAPLPPQWAHVGSWDEVVISVAEVA